MSGEEKKGTGGLSALFLDVQIQDFVVAAQKVDIDGADAARVIGELV